MPMPTAHVLIIDDDAAVSEVIAAALQAEGYTTQWASSLCDALTLLAGGDLDAWGLVLSDAFARPPADPYVWLDQVRARTRAPVVICSGRPPGPYADHGARGYAAFLAKPFDLDDLSALVAALCRPRAGAAPGAGT